MEKGASVSTEKFAEALSLLEEAAKEKKDEIRSLITNKYVNLKKVVLETEGGLKSQVETATKWAADAVAQAKQVSAERASEFAKNLDENVHKTPWPYISGVAIGALLLGFILGKKN